MLGILMIIIFIAITDYVWKDWEDIEYNSKRKTASHIIHITAQIVYTAGVLLFFLYLLRISLFAFMF